MSGEKEDRNLKRYCGVCGGGVVISDRAGSGKAFLIGWGKWGPK